MCSSRWRRRPAPPGMPTRTFDSFAAAATECADSRVRLGFHFRYATDAGLELGERIALYSMTTRPTVAIASSKGGSAIKGNAPTTQAAPERGAFHGVSDTRPGESQDSTIERAFHSDFAHRRWANEGRPIGDAHYEPGGVSIRTSTFRPVVPIPIRPNFFAVKVIKTPAHTVEPPAVARFVTRARV